MDDLTSAVAETNGIEQLDLANLTVFVHGVPEGTELADSVASLPDVPAHVTVPLACGEVDAL